MSEASTPIDSAAPAFSCAATDEQTISLADLRGQNVVLYFYPKDSTPGCTTESQDFRDLHDQFTSLNTVILGASRDGLRSHANFRAKQELPFALLSDPDETLCKAYDVIKEKNMYGKKHMGIERSTFLIDAEGIIRAQWRKVKVKGHAATVLEAVREIQS